VKGLNMPNSKAYNVKRKHKKRREKIRADRHVEMSKAKKSTKRQMAQEGTLPKELLKTI